MKNVMSSHSRRSRSWFVDCRNGSVSLGSTGQRRTTHKHVRRLNSPSPVPCNYGNRKEQE